MTTVALSAAYHIACESCGGSTRLFGIEAHTTFAGAELRTYICDGCDQSEVLVVPPPMEMKVAAGK